MDHKPSNGDARRLTFLRNRVQSVFAVLVGIIIVVLYLGREIWVEVVAEQIALRYGWPVWLCEGFVWVAVFVVLGMIGACLKVLGLIEDELPASTEPNPHGKCPYCAFEYKWNGIRCEHCGYKGRAEPL